MVQSPEIEVAIQHDAVTLWRGYFQTLRSGDPLLEWGDVLECRLVPTKDPETIPPNADFQKMHSELRENKFI